MKSGQLLLACVCIAFLLSCSGDRDSERAGSSPSLESTGADTSRDIITTTDPSSMSCLSFVGISPGEFYDKANDELLFPEDTWFFEADYEDGTSVEVRIHPDVADTEKAARDLALRIAFPIGQLPPELRPGIERVGLLAGESTAQADGGGEGIHVYLDNMITREADSRFEETLFHESVHTSLDDLYLESDAWRTAQSSDGAFLTQYASELPDSEDLAESALYAYGLLYYEDRLSDNDVVNWRSQIPNRIEFFAGILSPPTTLDASLGCDSEG